MKRTFFVLLLAVIAAVLFAERILQHANAGNGHITIEEVRSIGVSNGWFVFHFGGPPVAVRTQVQSWANNRRDHIRANYTEYLEEWQLQQIQNNPWNIQFRWYFVVKNNSGQIIDSGFLFDNNQHIIWDSGTQFLSPDERPNMAVESFRGIVIISVDGSLNDRRGFIQRWINSQRRDTVAGDGNIINFSTQQILVRGRNAGVFIDIGFLEYGWNSGTSDLTAPILWME